jgi:superfamily II DNA or RNA helicase
MEKFIPWYPSIEEENFRELLWNKREFFELKYIANAKKTDEHEDKKYFLYPHQMFIERFMSPITPYDRLILFHNTGSGKTFSSIAVCESHKHLKSRALIIVKGNTSYMNFRDQIVKWYKIMGRDLSEIKKYYEIRKYISFSNVIRRLSDLQIKSKFSDRIVIIDEVHNLRSLDFQEDSKQTSKKVRADILNTEGANHLIYNQIWRLLHVIDNSKVLLLTATPMIDKADEIYSIMNLLLKENSQLSGTLERNNQLPDKDNLERLEKSLQGRISYLKSNEEMAEIKEQGVLIPGCRIKVIPSMMRGIQFDMYRKVDIRDVSDHVYRNSVYCSLMTLTDGSYGAKAFKNNIVERKDAHGKHVFMFNEKQKRNITRETLKILSCKYSKMIEIIESRGNELVFVFCEEVMGSGVIMIGCVLEALGYSMYNGEKFTQLDKKPRYTIYTGNPLVCPNPEERLHGFRSEENKYGEYVRILIGSRVSGEGISLVNIRQVHIITPHWNISTVIQAIGRAVRRDSHYMLKKSERLIKIYRHVAIADESENIKDIAKNKSLYTPQVSIDMYKYKVSERKEDLIRKVENIMRNNAIDYHLNVENESQFKQSLKDISSYLIAYNNNEHNNLNKCPTFSYIEDLFEKNTNINVQDVGIENELLSVIVDERTPLVRGKRLTLYGTNICIEPENFVHRKTTLEEFWKTILEKEVFSASHTINNTEKEVIEYFSKCPQKELINVVMSLNLDSKVRLVELSISERIPTLMSFFENSIIKKDGKWYHLMLYRAYEDGFSYSVSSEKITISGRTRKLDFGSKKWVFAENEEKDIVNAIITKSKASRTPMERLGIYGIVSTSDSKFRIRNIAFENNNEASRDSRKINRGRYIDSYSLSDMKLIAMYLFSNQISYSYILSQAKDMFPSIEKIVNSLKNMDPNSKQNIFRKKLDLFSDEEIGHVLENEKYDFKLFYWIATKKKQELRDTIVNSLIDNGMFVIL